MDPGIAGTFPPKAVKFNDRRLAQADGALKLEVFRMPQERQLNGLAVFVADAGQVVRLALNRLSQAITEASEDGERIYYLNVPGKKLIPGNYLIHVWAQAAFPLDVEVADYSTLSFIVPDTPFALKNSFAEELPPACAITGGRCLPTALENVIGPVESAQYTYFSGDLPDGSWKALRYDINNILDEATGPLGEKPTTLQEFEALTYS